MERDHARDFQELAETIGNGDPRCGRERIGKICNSLPSALSNWKVSGIPLDKQATLFAYLRKSNKNCPDWLLDISVPSEDETDKIPARRSGKQSLSV